MLSNEQKSFVMEAATILHDSACHDDARRMCAALAPFVEFPAALQLQAASSLLRQKQYKQAIEAYWEVVREHPGFALAHAQLGEAFLVTGDFDSARAALGRARAP